MESTAKNDDPRPANTAGRPLLFSVVVPAYNCARWVDEAIQSVLDQDRDDFEIIVIDDGSTDDTPKILARLARHARVIRQENAGVAAARNRGIEAARGQWIAFLDADDRFRPGHLDRLARAIATAPGAGLVYADAMVVDEHGRPRKRKHSPALGPDPFVEILLANNVTTSATAVRRACFDEIGRFALDLQGPEDWDLWLRLARRYRLVHVPAISIDYRRQEQGLVHTRGLALRVDNMTVLERARILAPELPAAVMKRARANAYVESAVRLLAGGDATSARAELILALKQRPLFPRALALLGLALAGPGAARAVMAWRRRDEGRREDFDGRLRVTHLITDSVAGGAEKVLYELVTRLDPALHDCKVIVMKEPGVTARRLEAAGIPVESLGLPAVVDPLYLARLPLAAARLVSLLRRHPPHVLHCWLFQANLLGRLAAVATSVPINLSSIRVMEMERTNQFPLDRATSRLVTHYVAVCDAAAHHTIKMLGLSGDRITTVPNGIDPTPFQNLDRGALRVELGIPKETKLIGAIGRLHRQKGIDLLLDAMPRLLEKHPDLVLLVAGDGPEAPALARQARANGLGESVRFLGVWSRVPDFMAALDVLALPSRWEGMPNVVLEAMAAGTPVVATDVGGTPELIVSGEIDRPAAGETGLLAPPENHEALARALVALLDDESRAAAMGLAAGERVRANFAMERMVGRYQDLYLRLLTSLRSR